MKKKGFTLVELLAVIAILAILILIALPNIIKLYNGTKQKTFENEVINVYNNAQHQYVKDSIRDGFELVYAKCNDEVCDRQLSLNERTGFEYYIKFDSEGNVVQYYADDGNFQYSYKGLGLKVDDIKDSKDISQMVAGVFEITCNGMINTDTLYKVMENKYLSGDFVQKYSGPHKDSFSEDGTKDIYYFHQPDGVTSPTVQEKDNVIFANQCWEIIRTTDTGGVKLLYNGKVENNSCLPGRKADDFGYYGLSYKNLASDYYYADDFEYNPSTGNFKLTGNIFKYNYNYDNLPDISAIKGKYSCLYDDPEKECTQIYKPSYTLGNTIYAIILSKRSGNNHFATSSYYVNRNYIYSFADVGYMTNKRYEFKSINDSFSADIGWITTYNMSYIYYSDSIIWDETDECWKLENPISGYNVTSWSILKDKYMAYYEGNNKRCAGYVRTSVKNGGNSAYVKISTLNLEKRSTCRYDKCIGGDYTFGDDYSLDSNGNAVLTNPVTINSKELIENSSNYNNKVFCAGNSNTCSEPRIYTGYYIPSYNNIYMKYKKVHKFANSFTYSNGKYHLKNPVIIDYNNDLETIKNNHYTCFNISGECEKIAYIGAYYGGSYTAFYSSNPIGYIELSNGESLEDAMHQMLNADDVNKNDSLVKTIVDIWYEHNMSEYTNYLEDTIFCNYRVFDTTSDKAAGWNPNGGDESREYSYYDSIQNLSCPNQTDQFSVSNPKARLKYPVALLTAYEHNMINYYYNPAPRYQERSTAYWLMTPYNVYQGRSGGPAVGAGYYSTSEHISWGLGVRPSISLKPGVGYSFGDGSPDNPFVIDAN